jgi:hypothetical protein
VLGIARPVARRREVRARARAQADRLADVQRAAVGVAEDVDARVLRQLRDVGRWSRGRGARAPRLRGARCGRSSASASPIVRRVRAQRGNSAQNTRAQVSASGSARCTAPTSIPSASASAASPRRRCSGASRRASATVHSTGGSGQSSAGARERLLQHAAVEARVVGDEHAPAAAARRSLAGHGEGGGAASTMACEMPVKRWMPRPERLSTPDAASPSVVELAAADQHGADSSARTLRARARSLRVDREDTPR